MALHARDRMAAARMTTPRCDGLGHLGVCPRKPAILAAHLALFLRAGGLYALGEVMRIAHASIAPGHEARGGRAVL